MVAAGFFAAIALALTPLSASGVRLATGLAAACLALAADYAIQTARTLRRPRRDQAGTFGPSWVRASAAVRHLIPKLLRYLTNLTASEAVGP
jgi:hypothetical protein